MNINEKNYLYYIRKFTLDKTIDISLINEAIHLVIKNNNYIVFKKIFNDSRYHSSDEEYADFYFSLQYGSWKICKFLLDNVEFNNTIKEHIIFNTQRLIKKQDLKTLQIIYHNRYEFTVSFNSFNGVFALEKILLTKRNTDLVYFVLKTPNFIIHNNLLAEFSQELLEKGDIEMINIILENKEDFYQYLEDENLKLLQDINNFKKLKNNISLF